MKKAYIIVFDKEDMDSQLLHNAIRQLYKQNIISNWWHYIKTCYIVISTKSANELSTQIANLIISKKKYLIIELKLSHHQGYLNQDAWKWITEQSNSL